jgi:hypothetical protein
MRLSLAFATFLCTASFAQNALTPEEKAAGWRLLFDGKTFTNWRDPARQSPPGESWIITDGCLQAVVKVNRVREDLLTAEEFGDFEMTFEWRLTPGANSGVKYLIQTEIFLSPEKIRAVGKRFAEIVGDEMEKPMGRSEALSGGAHAEGYTVSFEYQLIDDARHPDVRRGRQYSAGSLYGLVPPTVAASRPIGEFNQSRLVVRGDHVEHWLNGVKVVDASLDSPEVEAGLARRWKAGAAPKVYDLLTKRPHHRTHIALQNHGDVVYFRNLKIRPL